MTPRAYAYVTVGILTLSGLPACTIEPIGGGRIASMPRRTTASYRVVDCVIVNNQKRVRLGKPVWYHVGADEAGSLVFERGPTGRVVAFENRWTNKAGKHSLVWVHGGRFGYHIVLPWHDGGKAERLLWRIKDVRQIEDNWRPRPKAMPYARCVMERQKAPGKSAPAPSRPPARKQPLPRTPAKTPPRPVAR